MSKAIKILLAVFISIIGIIIIAVLLTIIFFPGEKVKKLVEEKASEAIEMLVTIDKVGLTFTGIPALKVSGIVIGDPREDEPALFNMTSAKIRVNLKSLLKKRVDIISVELVNPALTLINRSDGSSNLPLTGKPSHADTERNGDSHRPTETNAPPSIPFPVSLKTLEINGMRVEIDNRDTTGSHIILGEINSLLNFDINEDLDHFTSSGKTAVNDIIYVFPDDTKRSGEPHSATQGISAGFAHELSGNITQGDMTLSRGDLSVNGIPVNVNAAVENWNKISFTAVAEKLDIERVLKAVPDGLVPEADRLTAEGTFSLRVDGTLDTESEEPAIVYSGRLDIDIGHLSYEDLPQSVDEITSHIAFSEKDIEIKDTRIRIGKSAASVSGTVKDYPGEPEVAIISSGNVDLKDIANAFPLPGDMTASGMVDFDLAMNGAPSAPETFAAKGNIRLSGIAAVIPETLNNPAEINGTIQLTPAAVNLKNITMKSGNSDASLSGQLRNYMALAGLGKGQALFKGTMRSSMLDLNDLMVTKEKSSEPEEPVDIKETLKTLPIPMNLSSDITITLGNVVFDKLKAGAVRGRVKLENGVLGLSGLDIAAYSGKLAGAATADFSDVENVTYRGKVDLKSLESGDFLDAIFDTGEFVTGKLSSSLEFAGAGLDSASIVNNLAASGNMVFDSGKFVNFEFTKKLGGYLKFLDFDVLEFDRIANSFRVENQKLFTPDIALKTEFGDILVDGFTGFDTSVEYDIILNLNKETSKLALKNLSSLTQYLTASPERLELNIKASGTLTSPSFKLDTSEAEKLLKDSLKESIKDRLSEEVDKLLSSPDQKELKEKGKELLRKLFK
jgi:hypothetical protein